MLIILIITIHFLSVAPEEILYRVNATDALLAADNRGAVGSRVGQAESVKDLLH